MRVRTLNLLAGASLSVIASVASAQTPVATTPAADASEFKLEEIIVSARRKSESLQDVPTVVDVVTADSLAKLNIQKFEDVQSLVPGLQLTGSNLGYTSSATVRGAAFQNESGASPTVEFYLNDANLDSVQLFQSMFDVGQIEVLRGPQGTLRGRSAPSGSITVTTHKADLNEMGGYVSATGTNLNSDNVNAAFNLPVWSDKLAIRIAGVMDNNEYDRVHNIQGGVDPSSKTRGIRASLRFEPNDAIAANVMAQHLTQDLVSYSRVESLSLVDPSKVQPATDPVIHAEDNLAITDGASINKQVMDVVNGQLDYRFLGQKLSYVGSYTTLDLVITGSPTDAANAFPGVEFNSKQHTDTKNMTHELRLASEERIFDHFDYTVGAFYREAQTPTYLLRQTPILAGGALVAVANSNITRNGTAREVSEFASVTWHIGDKTELAGGVRHMDVTNKGLLNVASGGVTVLSVKDPALQAKPNVWNVSLSQHFTDDFMAYVNVGTAWRLGPTATGIFRPTTPNLTEFTHLKNEDSTSYELGFKSTFLEQRLRLNAAIFHQDYDNYIYRGPSVWYVDLGRAGPLPAQFNFVSSVPVKVDGVELDSAFQVTQHLNVGAAFSYAKGEIKNGRVACTDLNGDGAPDVNPDPPTLAQLQASLPAGEAVDSCNVNIPSATAPEWSATLQGEYAHPIKPTMDAYLRGLYSYYPSNDQDPFSRYDDVGSYGLLNLFTGVRDPSGAWEVSIFAKNVIDTSETLNRSSSPAFTSASTTTGGSVVYTSSFLNNVRQTPPREFGVSVRYAFGSR